MNNSLSSFMEAFDFEDDVTAEAVAIIQKQADIDMAGEEWTCIDGYNPVPRRLPRSDGP